MVLVYLIPYITIGSHQQQADIDADLRQSVDALLEPVRARVARIEPPRKDAHAGHPQRAQREEHTRRKAADPGQNRRAAQPRAARDQRRQQQKKADRHENPHLNEHGPDVPAEHGGDQLPKHLHDAGEQADERPGDKEQEAPASCAPPPLIQEWAIPAGTAHSDGLFSYCGSIQLCARRDVRVDHEQVQSLLALLAVHGRDEHTARVDAHHLARGQVDDGDAGLSNQLLGLIVLVDAGEDDAVGAGAVVEDELQELLALLHRLAGLDLHGAEVGLAECVEVDIVGKERLDLHLGEVDLLLRGGGDLGGGRSLLGNLLVRVQRLHCRDDLGHRFNSCYNPT